MDQNSKKRLSLSNSALPLFTVNKLHFLSIILFHPTRMFFLEKMEACEVERCDDNNCDKKKCLTRWSLWQKILKINPRLESDIGSSNL